MKGKGIVYRVERSIRHEVIDDFRRRFHALKGIGVKVGLPKSTKPQPARRTASGKKAKGAQPVSMVTIGATLNYGTIDGRIPPRPWLSPGIRAAKVFLHRLNAINLRKFVKGDMTAEKAAALLGAAAAGKVQEYMNDRSHFKENAQSTIDAKGSDQPLKDIGRLIQSVTYTEAGQKKGNG